VKKLIKVALMVVLLLLVVIAPPVRADDERPPCKPEQHDCRCDPGHNPECPPVDPPITINICYVAIPKPPPLPLLDRNPWTEVQINPSDLVSYTSVPTIYVGLYVMGPQDVCPRAKALFPFIKNMSDDMSAARNP
jgi:hypothetical protein